MVCFEWCMRSISACASPAPATFAHDELALLQVCLGDSAYAGGLVVGVLLDDAGEAAQLLKPLLLPLRYQNAVCELLRQQVLVELARDFLFGVEEVVDVSGPLVMDLRDLPICLCLALGVHWSIFGILHLLGELVQHGEDVFEALRRPLCLECSDFGHVTIIKGIDLFDTVNNY